MKDLVTTNIDVNTFLPVTSSRVNKAAVAKVIDKLPALTEQTKVFGRSNSQSMLTMMTLTMMNGQSPMRMLRQVLAETNQKRMALAESQIIHAKILEEISELELIENPTSVEVATLRKTLIQLEEVESSINGCFKDVAVLIDAYEHLQKKSGLDCWDETTFEKEEKRHHIRRGFELLYRNILQNNRATETPIEYLMQYGVHAQQAEAEIRGYVLYTNERISKGEILTSSDCENFLDEMSHKYLHCADEATERMFGEKEISNSDYMLRLEAKE